MNIENQVNIWNKSYFLKKESIKIERTLTSLSKAKKKKERERESPSKMSSFRKEKWDLITNSTDIKKKITKEYLNKIIPIMLST